jgi:hypothetical protein
MEYSNLYRMASRLLNVLVGSTASFLWIKFTCRIKATHRTGSFVSLGEAVELLLFHRAFPQRERRIPSVFI